MLAGYQKVSKVVIRECLHRGPGTVSSGFPIEAVANDKLLEVGKSFYAGSYNEWIESD
jgi:hypothetical protein